MAAVAPATSVGDLLRDLRPRGRVYLSDPRFPQMLRINKTELLSILEDMRSDDPIAYSVRNRETDRYIVLQASS